MTFGQMALLVGAVLVVFLIVFAVRGNPYKAIFADAHVIELCDVLDRIRTAACERVEDERGEFSADDVEAARRDPRSSVTSAGLVLHYTVTRYTETPDQLSHHLSISHPKGLMAEAAARFLAGISLLRGSVRPEAATVRRSQNLVIHVIYEIDRRQHEAFAAHRMPLPTEADLREFRQQAGAAGDAVDFGTFDVALPPGSPPAASSS